MSRNISFASLNLYNLQWPGDSVHGKVMSQSLYNKKRDWTRSMLIKMDADVIAFQELWSKKCLDDVFDTPELDDYELSYIGNNWYSIAVAIAVRKPWKVKSKRKYKDFPFTNIVKVDEGDGEDDELELKIKGFSRTVLKVVLEHIDQSNTPEISVFACHLKSKLPAQTPNITRVHRSTMGSAVSTIRRTAEAAALRWILTNQLKGTDAPTVVIGDLNDDPRSNTLSLITQQPNLTANARGSDNALYSALHLQQLKSYRDIFYTHEFNNMKDTLDHILVSQEFFEHAKGHRWSHKETRIWNDYLEDSDKATGDHGAIRAEFKWG